MLQKDQAPIKDGVYDVKQIRVTNNSDGTVKVDLIIPLGSFVIEIASSADIIKAKV